jgi:hypothetical protein
MRAISYLKFLFYLKRKNMNIKENSKSPVLKKGQYLPEFLDHIVRKVLATSGESNITKEKMFWCKEMFCTGTGKNWEARKRNDKSLPPGKKIWESLNIGKANTSFGYRGTMLSLIGLHEDTLPKYYREWMKSNGIEDIEVQHPHQTAKQSLEVRKEKLKELQPDCILTAIDKLLDRVPYGDIVNLVVPHLRNKLNLL